MSFKFQSLLCFFAVIPLAGKKFFVCSLGGAASALGRKWQLTTQRIITTRVERLKVKEWDEARLGDKSSICLRLGTRIMSFFEHRQLLPSRFHMYTRVWRYPDFFTFPVIFSRTIFSVLQIIGNICNYLEHRQWRKSCVCFLHYSLLDSKRFHQKWHVCLKTNRKVGLPLPKAPDEVEVEIRDIICLISLLLFERYHF